MLLVERAECGSLQGSSETRGAHPLHYTSRLREGSALVQGHAANEWQIENQYSGLPPLSQGSFPDR